MLNIARLVIGASNSDRLFVTCETCNCLPDPFQVLAGCTIGNNGLKIVVPGKLRKKIAICEGCKESFVQREEEVLCITCLEHLQMNTSSCSFQ